MSILKYLDVAIAFSLVIIVVSSLVTALNEAVMRAISLRSTNLHGGLKDLLGQITVLLPHADDVAKAVLHHPLISRPGWLGMKRQPGTVIRREELIRVLLDLAKGFPQESKAALATDGGGNVDAKVAELQQAITDAVASDDRKTPAEILTDIQQKKLDKELLDPKEAAPIREAAATIEAAKGALVRHVYSWFDDTMERLTQQFAMSAQKVTVACALVVAFALPFDSLALLERLSVDDKLRETLVNVAQEKCPKGEECKQEPLTARERDEILKPALSLSPDRWWISKRWIKRDVEPQCGKIILSLDERPYELAVECAKEADPQGAKPGPQGAIDSLNRALMEANVPARAHWSVERPGTVFSTAMAVNEMHLAWEGKSMSLIGEPEFHQAGSLFGILLSWVLLSLGTPFWYDMLKNLLKLRSPLAEKEEKEREERSQK